MARILGLFPSVGDWIFSIDGSLAAKQQGLAAMSHGALLAPRTLAMCEMYTDMYYIEALIVA